MEKTYQLPEDIYDVTLAINGKLRKCILFKNHEIVPTKIKNIFKHAKSWFFFPNYRFVGFQNRVQNTLKRVNPSKSGSRNFLRNQLFILFI